MPNHPADYSTLGGPIPKPPILYHYSNWTGAFEILRTKLLRMGHSQFLNDRREMVEGVSLIQRALDDAMVSHNDEKGMLWDASRKDWQKDFSDVNVFLASFCEQGDVLEQWRGYTPQGGLALGFSTDEMKTEADKQQLWLMNCLYYDHDKLNRVHAFIDQTNKTIADPKTEDAALFSDYVCAELMMEIPRYKDQAFISEREWRLFVYDNVLDGKDRVSFYVNDRGIVPYREFPFDPKMLKEIVLHPKTDDAAVFGVSEFLVSVGFSGVTVRKSVVPLRF